MNWGCCGGPVAGVAGAAAREGRGPRARNAEIGITAIPEVGLEQPAHSSANTPVSDRGGAESGAPGAPNPHSEAIADALADLPQAERSAVVEHIRRLAELSPAKRRAILTLTGGGE